MKRAATTAFVALCIGSSFAACRCDNVARSEPDAAPLVVADVHPVADAHVDWAAAVTGDASVAAQDAAVAIGAASSIDAAVDASFPLNADDLRWQKKDALTGLAASCSWAPPFHTPKQPEGAGGIEPRHGKDAASWDCEDEEFSQGCVYDPCANAGDACLSSCAKTCRSCAQSCIDDCGSCEAACTDDACRFACAKITATCHGSCSHSRHVCGFTRCDDLPEKCTKRIAREWAASDCPKSCSTLVACSNACEAEGGTADGPCTKGCKHAFASSCPGNGLAEICLINDGP